MSSPYLSPSFFEIIQITSKAALCLQALPMHTHPFSGMPCTFPLLSTNLQELLPSLKTLPLKENAICTSSPLFLQLSAQLSCTPPLTHQVPQEAPEGLLGMMCHPWQAKCQQHSAVRGGWHAPAHQLQANHAPHTCLLFWEASEAHSQKT